MGFKRRLQRNLLKESLKRMPPPFSGELMQCVICGAVEQSDLNNSKGWRCIELNGRDRYYICNPDLPMDNAPSGQWQYVYLLAFEHIVKKTPGYKPARSVLIWREIGGQVSSQAMNN